MCSIFLLFCSFTVVVVVVVPVEENRKGGGGGKAGKAVTEAISTALALKKISQCIQMTDVLTKCAKHNCTDHIKGAWVIYR